MKKLENQWKRELRLGEVHSKGAAEFATDLFFIYNVTDADFT